VYWRAANHSLHGSYTVPIILRLTAGVQSHVAALLPLPMSLVEGGSASVPEMGSLLNNET
jgi:hypothetical protein